MNIVSLISPFVTGILKADETFFENVSKFSVLEQTVSDLSNRLAADVLSSILSDLDRMVRESSARKSEYNVQRTDSRSLISSVGDVRFQSTLYRKRDTGEFMYLTERLLHLPKNEHFTTVAEAKVLSESTVHSYQHAADQLSIGNQKVSKVAVMNKVHAIDAAMLHDEQPEAEEKRKCEYLYIEADEDHIHKQHCETEEVYGRKKNNCMIGKLIYLFEGKEDECDGRRRLVHPFYFGGLYLGKDNACLWSEVEKYIEDHYDLDVLKRVYINSDGGAWIKAGKDYIDRSKLVADRFHLMKYINRVCRLTGDMELINKGRFYKYIWKRNLVAIKKMLTRIERKYGSPEVVENVRLYFLNNWDAIKRTFHDHHVIGCSAEGHVSNILSDRMSSRPMGWSETGSDHMCKLRCYVRNYGRDDIIDLVKWRRETAFQEQLRATGTDGFVEDVPHTYYTKRQLEAASYAERMQASLDGFPTVKKIVAIRNQIGNI